MREDKSQRVIKSRIDKFVKKEKKERTRKLEKLPIHGNPSTMSANRLKIYI